MRILSGNPGSEIAAVRNQFNKNKSPPSSFVLRSVRENDFIHALSVFLFYDNKRRDRKCMVIIKNKHVTRSERRQSETHSLSYLIQYGRAARWRKKAAEYFRGSQSEHLLPCGPASSPFSSSPNKYTICTNSRAEKAKLSSQIAVCPAGWNFLGRSRWGTRDWNLKMHEVTHTLSTAPVDLVGSCPESARAPPEKIPSLACTKADIRCRKKSFYRMFPCNLGGFLARWTLKLGCNHFYNSYIWLFWNFLIFFAFHWINLKIVQWKAFFYFFPWIIIMYESLNQ